MLGVWEDWQRGAMLLFMVAVMIFTSCVASILTGSLLYLLCGIILWPFGVIIPEEDYLMPVIYVAGFLLGPFLVGGWSKTMLKPEFMDRK